MVAFMSLTASQIETTVGRCAMAPGSCAERAWSAIEPDTPTFTNALPGGKSFATRAGHEPLAGSVAPTPTASDAPIATYRTVPAGAAVGVTRTTVDEGEAWGAAVGARDGDPEHAEASSRTRMKLARSNVRIDGA